MSSYLSLAKKRGNITCAVILTENLGNQNASISAFIHPVPPYGKLKARLKDRCVKCEQSAGNELIKISNERARVRKRSRSVTLKLDEAWKMERLACSPTKKSLSSASSSLHFLSLDATSISCIRHCPAEENLSIL